MLQYYLINVLIFTGIILLIALIVAAVQGILILIDVRKTAKEIKTKITVLTSALDIVSLFLGGVEGAKHRFIKKVAPNKTTILAFISGVKKGLSVLMSSKGGEK